MLIFIICKFKNSLKIAAYIRDVRYNLHNSRFDGPTLMATQRDAFGQNYHEFAWWISCGHHRQALHHVALFCESRAAHRTLCCIIILFIIKFRPQRIAGGLVTQFLHFKPCIAECMHHASTSLEQIFCVGYGCMVALGRPAGGQTIASNFALNHSNVARVSVLFVLNVRHQLWADWAPRASNMRTKRKNSNFEPRREKGSKIIPSSTCRVWRALLTDTSHYARMRAGRRKWPDLRLAVINHRSVKMNRHRM